MTRKTKRKGHNVFGDCDDEISLAHVEEHNKAMEQAIYNANAEGSDTVKRFVFTYDGRWWTVNKYGTWKAGLTFYEPQAKFKNREDAQDWTDRQS